MDVAHKAVAARQARPMTERAWKRSGRGRESGTATADVPFATGATATLASHYWATHASLQSFLLVDLPDACNFRCVILSDVCQHKFCSDDVSHSSHQDIAASDSIGTR